jgi:hypothetical protein
VDKALRAWLETAEENEKKTVLKIINALTS